MKGKIIVIEGLDGSGKTTIVNKVTQHLNGLNIDAAAVPMLGNSGIPGYIRSMLSNEDYTPDRLIEVLLMATANYDTITNTVMPMLKNGVTVVMDRYVSSYYAYQIYNTYTRVSMYDRVAQTIMTDVMQPLMELAAPDLFVYLDVSPHVAMERIRKRGKMDAMDDMSKNEKNRIYDGYRIFMNRSYIDRKKMMRLDTNTHNPDEICSILLPRIERLFLHNNPYKLSKQVEYVNNHKCNS